MLWIALVALASIATLFMLLPLRAGAATTSDRVEGSISILADQLRELEVDAERGLITPDEARAAQVEIKRRLLTLHRRGAPANADPSGQKGRWIVWLTALLVPLAAGALYTQLGSPEVPSVAYADRQAERDEQTRITELTQRLTERLESDPQGGPVEGWMLLAQTYMRMGRHADAASAVAKVVDRPDATSATLSLYAEALVAADDGIVTPKARDAIRAALKLDPSSPAATFYEAIALSQAGESAQAHDLLVSRLNAAGRPEPWMEIFIAQANRIGAQIGRVTLSLADFAPMTAGAAPGPSESDVAAAAEMNEADRAAFIRSMVERLAERLVDAPDDLDGWMRLGNAYRVLGETDSARDAYANAESLAATLPPGDPRPQIIRQALSELDAKG